MSENKHKKGGTPSFVHSRLISIISISMVLFLLGIVTMLGLVGNGLKTYVRESVNFTVVLSPEAEPEEITIMEAQLKQEPFVKGIKYFSKEEALQELTKELGESPEEFLGWNPLSPTFEITLKEEYVSERDSIAIVEQALNSYLLTQSLSYKQDLVEQINSNIQTLTIVMIVLAVLLLLISTVLINNTIRLLIYSKRFLIYTMKLVGATPSFIRRPFVRYNIWSGIMAAVVASGFLGWLWYHLITNYPLMQSVLTIQNALIVVGVVFVLGILISWLSASGAVTKYLRMNVNKLYRA
ncbi:MAG: permease-like cell division protein FtsX [Bacteroidales bacterium]|uniref:cell division protein FtsX n=1 Tax=Porphyromonas sp. TaxID=1924944 RepID=UPI002976AD38|nr:permease-like cell division protein FtsX [Porphyromonas sp.]MDD7438664.1 permease-like cell division protein FtsX [Bacteroidales bacterium]MDY3066922.1 permease-like cell division protein FtsX [Porphyromonas sp.]